jgi:hypothetical protein
MKQHKLPVVLGSVTDVQQAILLPVVLGSVTDVQQAILPPTLTGL